MGAWPKRALALAEGFQQKMIQDGTKLSGIHVRSGGVKTVRIMGTTMYICSSRETWQMVTGVGACIRLLLGHICTLSDFESVIAILHC